MDDSPRIFQQTRRNSHPQSHNFHGLQREELAEGLKELWLITEVGEEVTLVPQARVVCEQVVVALAELQVIVEARVVALQQLLQALDGGLVVRRAADLDDVVRQQRLVVIIIAWQRVQHVPEEGGPAPPGGDDDGTHRATARLRR